MGKPGNTGLRRIVNATFFSLAGFRTAWREEAAFRQEALLCVVLVPAAFWLGRTAVERSLLIGSCLLVLIVELLNTGIENVVDRVGQEHASALGPSEGLGLGRRVHEPRADAARLGPDRLGAVRAER